ncbi:MAG TPA: sigma-70 family RNA polymerase sigma factor [Thermoanaerobaculia bacterium]|nr:sigma-70 family RNA polymerase sigma factor [Thermoanaerobaculia bacterium]
MPDRSSEMFFAALLESTRSRLAALCASFRVAPQDFEDLVQESLLALWRKRREIENPEAWLIRALRLECLRYQRREIRQRRVASDEATLELLADAGGPSEEALGLHHDLRTLIRDLPARHRALIYLRFELGLTSEETARHLGYRPTRLKKTTTRCLQTLRSNLIRPPALPASPAKDRKHES